MQIRKIQTLPLSNSNTYSLTVEEKLNAPVDRSGVFLEAMASGKVPLTDEQKLSLSASGIELLTLMSVLMQ